MVLPTTVNSPKTMQIMVEQYMMVMYTTVHSLKTMQLSMVE